MTYAGQRVCCDADSHIMETFEFVSEYADPELRPLLLPLNMEKMGHLAKDAVELIESVRRNTGKARPAPESIIDGQKGWAAYGAFDREERSLVLDDFGFRCQLVFPTLAGTQFMHGRSGEIFTDPKLRYGGARAFNRAMAEFCSQDKRLLGVAIVPLDDPELARQEIILAARAGLRAIQVPASPGGERSPGHSDFDVVWKTMCDQGQSFMLHIGLGVRDLNPAYNNTGQPNVADWLGGGENIRIQDYMALSFPAQKWLSAMLFHGVFNRFPDLRGGVIEFGAGWVPDFLRRLDLGQRMFHKSDPGVAALKKPGSEIMKQHVKFTPVPGEDVGLMIREAGDDAFMFSTDYPHVEGGKNPIKRFEDTMGDVAEAARERFYSKNFEHMMNMTI